MKANFEPIRANNIVYPKLSYEVMAVLFKVHNHLGRNFQEKYYQRAIEIEFERRHVSFDREKLVKLEYEGKSIGRYFIDFVVEGKIALEIKASDYFKKQFTAQVLAYLSSAHLKLAIIANFNSEKLLYKRYINPRY